MFYAHSHSEAEQNQVLVDVAQSVRCALYIGYYFIILSFGRDVSAGNMHDACLGGDSPPVSVTRAFLRMVWVVSSQVDVVEGLHQHDDGAERTGSED